MNPIPNREAALARLQGEGFDVLVIGGGATGCGVALDAATRGLKVALVEGEDFSAGTSSRSTKLIHGGVRYLEKAVLNMDRSQFRLVRDALGERTVLLRIAPHLARWLPILTPVYKRIEMPYYRTGLRMYDWLAGKAIVHRSKFITRAETLKKLPMLKGEGLKGSVVYYDGQFDDSRMNISIALKAAELGAALANHTQVEGLQKKKGRITGVDLVDRLTGKKWTTPARVVVNATGPFIDRICKLDDPKAPPMLSASSGSHIVLDRSFPLPEYGILIPKTEDKRVLFLLPWLGHTLAGTTDNPARITDDPKASEEDQEFILRQVNQYSAIKVTKKNIVAAWSGLRPLVAEGSGKNTASISRDHVVSTSDAGLISIAGGKWTTYRLMALDTVDEAIRVGELKPLRESQTETTKVMGGEKFDENKVPTGLPEDIARHLHYSYGDRAAQIVKLAEEGHGDRLAKEHPFIEAEVLFAAREEYARSTIDVIARRFRLAFLDQEAARKAVPRVGKMLAEVLGWTPEQLQKDQKAAKAYLA